MNRRGFFEWIGKMAAAVGLGYLAFNTGSATSADETNTPLADFNPVQMRMNGRACSDYRMISANQPNFLDKDIFGA
ncbi:MAG: hypothetical protein A2W25_06515 [candidate division Zixibacteria bacterium RBG_16_53_22]|nr:MAG: hypothetical protein A2W25_06515 [candidate division Zixibacteria bacterium RBG_16_53_22]